jgi:3-oxoadipate enol-lactonase
MSEPRTTIARINGLQMRFADEGRRDGPVVVLHHPLATDLTFWDELTAALAQTYRVIRFDARGHGKTEAPAGRYAFEVLATDVVALMDHLKVERAAFAGLSMGGMVAQYLGMLHPGRFKALAICATTSRVPVDMRHLWRDRVVVAREKGMASQVEPALGRWITPESRAYKPALVARFTRLIEATPLEGYAGWCGAIEQLDTTDRLGAIKLPTIVISGEKDLGSPPAAGETMHKAIPGSSFVVVPNVGHMIACEDPAAFHAALLPFLTKHA